MQLQSWMRALFQLGFTRRSSISGTMLHFPWRFVVVTRSSPLLLSTLHLLAAVCVILRRGVGVRMQHCSSWQRSPMCQLSARHVLLLCPRELDSFRVRVTAINCRVRLWVDSVTFVVFLFFLAFPVFLEGRSPVISVAMNTDTSFQKP